MRKTRTVEQEYLECDGCQYLVNSKKPMVVVSVPFDYPFVVDEPDAEWETTEFHFHTLADRHDCFRYWAHNPSIMRRSLKERNFTDSEIEDFMELMLYREKVKDGVAKI